MNNTNLFIRQVLIPFLFLLVLINCQNKKVKTSQTTNSEKLDPKLYSLIMEKSAPTPNIQPINKTKNGTLLYSVIIYNSNPDSLRTLGIQVNSELSKFVTARVTKTQLKKCILLDFVSYIKASERHQPDGR